MCECVSNTPRDMSSYNVDVSPLPACTCTPTLVALSSGSWLSLHMHIHVLAACCKTLLEVVFSNFKLEYRLASLGHLVCRYMIICTVLLCFTDDAYLVWLSGSVLVVALLLLLLLVVVVVVVVMLVMVVLVVAVVVMMFVGGRGSA